MPLRSDVEIRGEHGWLALVVFVTLWDLYAPETLSRAFWRAVDHPIRRWWVLAAWCWVTSHLFLRRPRRILYFA